VAYTLAQAAEATGNNRTTILRAIKAGKVSATKDAHGSWLVEPARAAQGVSARTGGRTP
jgi:predicted site-specific integrase-resolvase